MRINNEVSKETILDMKSIKITFLVLWAFLFVISATVLADNCASHKVEKTVDVPKSKMADVTMAAVGMKAPGFKLMDAMGEEHSLSDFKDKYVVLEWVNFDCPFVKKHYGSENMQKLQAMHNDEDVVWLSICSSAPGKQGYFEGKALKERIAKENSKSDAYLVDANGKVGRMYGAKTTPHMFVIDPNGILIYDGAIDDKPSTKTADIDGSTNYVQWILDSSMKGEEVVKSTAPYGCSVKY